MQVYLLCILLGLLGVHSLEARTWTDVYGRTFQGDLISADDRNVVLNIRGKNRVISLSSLSQIDRNWVQANVGGATSVGEKSRRVSNAPSATFNKSANQILADPYAKVERIEANRAEKRWVYATENFEFVSDEDLGLAKMRNFVWMFEAVWRFCEEWPIELPRLRAEEKVRMKTLLVKEREDYYRQGGMPGSGGVYLTARDLIIVPFDSLGEFHLGQGAQRRHKIENHVLRHEITHQLMRGQTQQAAWFIEGSAEYVATVPFSGYRMQVFRHPSAVVNYMIHTNYRHGTNQPAGRVMKLIPLQRFMNLSYNQFLATEHSYPYALMLFYYFAKLEGKKDGAILKAYTKALQRDQPEILAQKILLNGNTWEQLEKDLAQAWNQMGIRIQFVRN